MADGVEPVHACEPVADGAADGQSQVDIPQGLGGLGNARRELVVFHRSRRFRAVELHAADTEHGQYRNRQHDNAHAAQPLQLLTVELDGARQPVDACQHRGAGGGQARGRFEHRIGKIHVRLLCEQEGQSANQRQDHPEKRDYHEAVTYPQLLAIMPHRVPYDQAGHHHHQKGDREVDATAFIQPEGDQQRRQHGDTGHQQQQAQDSLNDCNAHGGFRRRLRQPGTVSRHREYGVCPQRTESRGLRFRSRYRDGR